MESIHKTLSTLKPALSESVARPLTLANVQHVFDRLKGQLGAKMADLWAGVPVNVIEREWMAGLAGFAKHELERGLAACSDRQFAPTLGEFKLLCRPCLNPEFAWLEAQDGLQERETGEIGTWTHPAAFFAAMDMPAEVRGGDWNRHRVRWTRVLAAHMSKGWRSIPAPPLRVPDNTRVGPPPAEVRERMRQLRERMAAAALAPRTEGNKPC